MLNSIKNLKKCKVLASDGDVGKVTDAYFDDQAWTVRHLVVDTGNWLSKHEVLLSPLSVSSADWEHERVHMNVSRANIENSPGSHTHLPVSRQAEAAMAAHYGIPYYRTGGGGKQNFSDEQLRTFKQDVDMANPEDAHLRSCNEVAGYKIAASDDSLGHVSDFLFDDEDWTIQYLVVDPRDLWPGKHVLVPVERIEHIDWADHRVLVGMTSKEVENSPAYDPDHLPPPSRHYPGTAGAPPSDRPTI